MRRSGEEYDQNIFLLIKCIVQKIILNSREKNESNAEQ